MSMSDAADTIGMAHAASGATPQRAVVVGNGVGVATSVGSAVIVGGNDGVVVTVAVGVVRRGAAVDVGVGIGVGWIAHADEQPSSLTTFPSSHSSPHAVSTR